MSFARCEISLSVSFFLNSVVIDRAAVLFPLWIGFAFYCCTLHCPHRNFTPLADSPLNSVSLALSLRRLASRGRDSPTSASSLNRTPLGNRQIK